MTTEENLLLEMLKNGVHFGHQKRFWHPKMQPYIYTVKGGLCIIDLEKTASKLEEATEFIRRLAGRGGKLLFVSTKRQAQEIVKKAARETGMPFVTERWIGGTLTNFDNISKLVSHLKDLRQKKEKGELDKYTKREKLKFTEEIEALEKLVGGIEVMDKLPEALFIIDTKKEKTALREARTKKIPVVAITDTNVNPELVDYPIPANDDATRSIQFIVDALVKALKNPIKPEKPEEKQSENN